MNKLYGTLLFLACTIQAFSQKGNIKGKIITTDGHAASYVTVTLPEVKKNVITDENGFFSFHSLKPGTISVVISYAGMQEQEKTVTVQESRTIELNVTLQETAQQLDEVVVNSKRSLNNSAVAIGKVAINPMDLPQSISVIGQGIIADQQALRLSDVIKNANGVYLSSNRASTQETFAARGYTFGSYNMFKNGTRINTGAMPEISSLERVEVLKGSAAILFGNVAPGGILNLVTRQPKFNFGGEVSLRAGSYDLYKPAFDVYGPLSKNIAYRINGTYEDANSYRDVVQSKRYYINPSLLFKLGRKAELLVQGDYLKQDFTPDFGIGSINNTKINDLPRSTFLGAPWQYTHTQQSTASVAFKYRMNEAWTFTFTGSYESYYRDYYSLERIQFDSTGNWNRPLGKTKTHEDYVIGQIDITGKFKTGKLQHTLLLGMDADSYLTQAIGYNVQGKMYDTLNIFDAGKFSQRTDVPPDTALSKTRTPVVRTGAYVQDLISISKKVKLLAGIRWSLQESRPATVLTYADGTTTKGAVKTDKAFSPRFGLVYKPFNTTSVFASYANSFVVNTGTDIYYNALSPSIVDQYEVGIKNEFFKGTLSVNLTAYKIKNNNLAQTALYDSAGNQNSNTSLKALTGQTESDGVELDISGHPAPGLNVMAGYSHIYIRYIKTPDAKGNYVEGQKLVGTPSNTANATAFYTFQNKLKGFKIGASVFYTGNRFGGWNDQKQQAQQYSRLIPVNAFTTIDISAGYTYKNISLTAKLSNVTNAYSVMVHENYSIIPIAPRQVIGTISCKF